MVKYTLNGAAISTYSQCVSYIKSNELAKAISKARYFVEMCQSILYEENTGEFEDINDVLLCGIFFFVAYKILLI